MPDAKIIKAVSDKTVRPNKRTSKERIKAISEFNAAHYDRLEVKLPRGQKQVVRDAAAALGESVNQFITKAIMDRLESLFPE